MKEKFWLLQFNSVTYDSIKKIKVWRFLPALIFIMTFSGLAGQQPEKLKDALVVPDAEEGPNLGSLVKDVHRAVYLNGGNQVIAGKETRMYIPNDIPNKDVMVAFCDAASVNNIYRYNPAFRNVKLLRIEIAATKENNVRLDLSRLNSFMNLKYILFLFSYNACGNSSSDCLEEIVREMVTGQRDGVRIIYELSIPQ